MFDIIIGEGIANELKICYRKPLTIGPLKNFGK